MGVAVPKANPAWWDVLRHGPRQRVRALVRHRLGAPDRSWCPCSADDVARRPARRGRRAALLRAPLPDRPRHRGRRPAGGPRAAALRAGRLAPGQRASSPTGGSSPSSSWPACGSRTPTVFDGDPRRDPALVATARRRHPRRPPGRAARPGAIPGPAARRRARRLAGRREDPRARRGAARPGRSTGPPATTRCARCAASSSTRPARRPSPSCTSASAASRTGTRPATSRSSTSPGGCFGAELRRLGELVPDLADARSALGAELAAASTSTAPTCRTAATTSTRPSPRPAGAGPTWAGTLDPLAPRLRDPADELAQRFQQLTGAVMAKGVEDTAMLPLDPVRRAQRGRRRPGPVRRVRRRVPRRQRRRGSANWPASDDHPRPPTTPSAARTCGPGWPCWPSCPASGPKPCARWRAAMPVPDPTFEHLIWQTVVGAWPIERERLHAYLQKAAREADRATSWTDPDEAFEGGAPRRGRRGSTTTRRCDDVAGVRGPDHPVRLDQLRSARSSCSSPCPASPTSTRAPSCGTTRWSTRTTGARSTSRPAGDLLARLDDGWLPPVDATGAAKLLVLQPGAAAAPGPAGAVHAVPRRCRPTGRRPRHVLAFDRGGVIAVATRLPVALGSGAAAGATTTLALPDGAWTDVLTRPRQAGPTVAEICSTRTRSPCWCGQR